MIHSLPSLLLIDNRDSFTYNIVDLLYRASIEQVDVVDSSKYKDAISWISYIEEHRYTHLIIGPGPGSPQEYPQIVEAILHISENLPILGICLGHQMIIHAYGGTVAPTGAPTHGKKSALLHNEKTLLFQKIPSPCIVGRYHSLAATFLPESLIESAYANGEDGKPVVMAIEHRKKAVYGVQFHPESFLTEYGMELIINFIRAV